MLVLTSAAALLAGRSAAAQDASNTKAAPQQFDRGRLDPVPDTPPYAPDIAPPEESSVWKPRTGYGVALTAGGGVGNFVSEPVRNSTGLQGAWDLRVAYGTRTYAGIEAAYVGAAGSVAGLGPSGGNNLLVRNGFEATLRLNAPLMSRRTFFEPYIFGGLGWDHYSVSDTNPTADLAASDDVLTVPFGVGFAVTYMGLVADARFAYRPTFEEDRTNNLASRDLSNWTAGGQLGYEF